MKKVIFNLIIGAFLFISCSGKTDTVKMTIASERADCVGVGPQKCLLVKEKDDPNWTFLYNDIEGFTYEPGYEYEIEVRKEQRENPAQDQSSLRYILVKEISKERKVSQDIPRMGT